MASKAGFMTSPERRFSQMSALSGSNQPSKAQPQQPASNRGSRALGVPVFVEPCYEPQEPKSEAYIEEVEYDDVHDDEIEPRQSTPKFTDQQTLRPSPLSSSSARSSASELIKLFDARAQEEQQQENQRRAQRSPRKKPSAGPVHARPQTTSAGSSRPRSPASTESLRPRDLPSLQDWVAEVDAEAKRRKAERRQRSDSEATDPSTAPPNSYLHRLGSGASSQVPPSQPHTMSRLPSRDTPHHSRSSAGPRQPHPPASAPLQQLPTRQPFSQQQHLQPQMYSPGLSDLSTDDTIFTLSTNVDILHHGELFYAPPSGLSQSGRFRWRPGRAVLIPGNLLLSYDEGGPKPVEKRLKLAGCTVVESVRLPHTTSGAQQEHREQAFKMQWTNGTVEHFACAKATERVHWLASILCVSAVALLTPAPVLILTRPACPVTH